MKEKNKLACLPDEKCCFNCDKWFNIKQYDAYGSIVLCKRCDQYKCPFCGKCFCKVSKAVRVAVRAMEKTYERYISYGPC